MVYLIEISREQLPELILLSYTGDNDLLNKYHIKKFKLKDAVKCELETIDQMATQLNLVYLKVIFENKPIGYVVKSGIFLYSFAVSIQYRQKEILKLWWAALKDNLGEKFTCGLLSNNTRAIEYMKKRGMRIIFENPEKKELNEILLAH